MRMTKYYSNNYSNNYIKCIDHRIEQNDINFCKWIDEVERIVLKKIKLHLLDLIDETYMDNFEEGMTITEMAEIVLRHNSI